MVSFLFPCHVSCCLNIYKAISIENSQADLKQHGNMPMLYLFDESSVFVRFLLGFACVSFTFERRTLKERYVLRGRFRIQNVNYPHMEFVKKTILLIRKCSISFFFFLLMLKRGKKLISSISISEFR